MADELELRLMRAIDPQHSNATTPSAQDEADSRHVRLTSTQGAALMLQPNVSRLRGRRDVAIIALLLATGLRQGAHGALRRHAVGAPDCRAVAERA